VRGGVTRENWSGISAALEGGPEQWGCEVIVCRADAFYKSQDVLGLLPDQ
jgi:hypothetical protein